MPKPKTRTTSPNPFVTSDHEPARTAADTPERTPAGALLALPGTPQGPLPSEGGPVAGSGRRGMAKLRAATGGPKGNKPGRKAKGSPGASMGRKFNSRHRG